MSVRFGADPIGHPWNPPITDPDDVDDPTDWLPQKVFSTLNPPSRPNGLYVDSFFEDVNGVQFPVEPDFFWDNVADFEQRLINLEAAVNVVTGQAIVPILNFFLDDDDDE